MNTLAGVCNNFHKKVVDKCARTWYVVDMEITYEDVYDTDSPAALGYRALTRAIGDLGLAASDHVTLTRASNGDWVIRIDEIITLPSY